MGEVVDSKLDVKGAAGLRVVDASVFPSHASGNLFHLYTLSQRRRQISSKPNKIMQALWGDELEMKAT